MSQTYQNPVFPDYFADPFVFRHGETYYAVGTGDVAPADRAFLMLRSPDLIHWEQAGFALVRPSEELGDAFWAPEIAEHEGRFYMYYSVGRADKGHRLRVAISDQPEGPYVDEGALEVPAEHPFTIDAHPFQDADGSWYLFYARDFLDTDGSTVFPGTALVVDRLIDMRRLAGEERVVLRASRPWQRFLKDRKMYEGVYDWHTLEGPFVVPHEGRYYCLYSGGRWEDETYGVDYAVADHPLGPWTGGDTEHPRVLRTVPGVVLGPGHNSVVLGPDGETRVICYHAWDPAMTARRLFIDPLVWGEDGPRADGPSTTLRQL